MALDEPIQDTEETTDTSTDTSDSGIYGALKNIYSSPKNNDAIANINVKDFYPKQTQSSAGLPNSEYFPSGSPATLEMIQGKGIYPQLPIVNSGQSLFPLGVIDARRKALEASALQQEIMKQKMAKGFMDSYKLQQGAPQYQQGFINEYADKILPVFDNYMNTHKDGISTWDTSPEKEQAVKDYFTLNNKIAASNLFESQYLKQAEAAQKGEKQFDTPTNDLLNKWFNGDMKGEDMMKQSPLLMSYISMDKKMQQLSTSIKPESIVNSLYQKGVPLQNADGSPKVDKDGNPVTLKYDGTNTIQFLNEAKKHGFTPEMEDNLTNLLKQSPDIIHDKNPDTDEKNIRQYLKAYFPNFIENALHEIKPDANAGDENKQNKYISGGTIPAFTPKSDETGKSTGVPTLGDVGSFGYHPIAKTNDQPKNIPINNANLGINLATGAGSDKSKLTPQEKVTPTNMSVIDVRDIGFDAKGNLVQYPTLDDGSQNPLVTKVQRMVYGTIKEEQPELDDKGKQVVKNGEKQYVTSEVPYLQPYTPDIRHALGKDGEKISLEPETKITVTQQQAKSVKQPNIQSLRTKYNY